jgi:putative Ig domain-containing protein
LLDAFQGSQYPPSPQTLTVLGGTPPYTWALDPNARVFDDDEDELVPAILPPGLVLDSRTGIISGTPTTTGAFAFRIIVTDALGQTGAHNFCIHVDPNQAASLVTTDLTTGVQTAVDLANSLLDPDDAGVVVSNVVSRGSKQAIGSFTGGGSGTQGVGFDRGMILSSGTIRGAAGPNNTTAFSTVLNQPGDADLAALAQASPVNSFDAAVLEFDFTPTCHDGVATCSVTFEYVFGSDEYSEFANTPFNDVFGFFLSDVTAGTPKKNFAVLPGVSPETPVSINTVNGGNPLGVNAKHRQFFRANRTLANLPAPLNLQADGLTTTLQFSAPITSGHLYHIKIGISDITDAQFDSWVFLKSGSFKVSHVCPVIVP